MPHTPGPWKVAPLRNRDESFEVGGVRGCARVYGTDAEAQANASLIAAAPELLDALKGAVLSVKWRALVMHGEHGINPDPEAHAALSRFADKCLALIAKVEGTADERTTHPNLSASSEFKPQGGNS